MEKKSKAAQEVSKLLDEVSKTYLHRSGKSSYAQAVGYYETLIWAVSTGIIKPKDIGTKLEERIQQFTQEIEQ